MLPSVEYNNRVQLTDFNYSHQIKIPEPSPCALLSTNSF